MRLCLCIDTIELLVLGVGIEHLRVSFVRPSVLCNFVRCYKHRNINHHVRHSRVLLHSMTLGCADTWAQGKQPESAVV